MEKAVIPKAPEGRAHSPAMLTAAFLLFAISITAAIHLFAGWFNPTPPGQPQLLFVSKRVANFGRFGPQAHPTLDFVVTNRSDHPLEIEHLVPSCTCISANCVPRDVAVGARAIVAVTYRGFPGVFGPFGKSVAVAYRTMRDGRESVLRLFVRGDAASGEPVRIYPRSIYAGDVVPGTDMDLQLYFRGWSCLVRSLPSVVRLRLGRSRDMELRRVGHSRATRDRSVRLILEVPLAQPFGKFRYPLTIIGQGIGPMRVNIAGRIAAKGPRHGRSTENP